MGGATKHRWVRRWWHRGWMLVLLALLIGSPVPAWAQTAPILDESMHPSLGVRLVFPCRPLPPPPALLAIGE